MTRKKSCCFYIIQFFVVLPIRYLEACKLRSNKSSNWQIKLFNLKYSGFKCLNPGYRHLNREFRCLDPRVRHLNPGFRHLNPGFRCLNPGFRCLNRGFRIQNPVFKIQRRRSGAGAAPGTGPNLTTVSKIPYLDRRRGVPRARPKIRSAHWHGTGSGCK